VGWAAPGRFKDTVEWLKFSSSLSVATLPQMAVASFMTEGGYQAHLRRVRRTYQQRMGESRGAVTRHFPSDIRVTDPGGGYLLWIELPDGIDALALDKGIAITPGHLFSAGKFYRRFIRLSAATWSQDAEPAILRLAGVIEKMV